MNIMGEYFRRVEEPLQHKTWREANEDVEKLRDCLKDWENKGVENAKVTKPRKHPDPSE